MSEFAFWPKRIFFLCTHFLLRSVLTVIYWGKRKTIPPISNSLLLKSATKLAKEIRDGKLKCEEVVEAYITRILEVNPYINAIVEDRFQDALEDAKNVDRLLESNEFSKKQLELEKPLLGVPFTVKILLSVKGFRCTAGSLFFKDRIADVDAEAVTLLKKAGGILLATTNSPEFGNSGETRNFLNGKTSNPYDTTKIPGGSSGGESALLSAAGSVIGLANDFMGSLRFPAFFCGLFSHKATVGWISNEGSFPPALPSSPFMLYVGPMCRYAEDLPTIMNILSSGDKQLIETNKQIDFRKLKIYYQTGLRHAWIPSIDKDIVQAIQNAANHFRVNYGSEVKEVNIPLLKKVNKIVFHSLMENLPSPISHVTNGTVTHLNFFTEIIKYFFGKSYFTVETILVHCFGKCFPLFNQKRVPFYEDLGKQLNEEFESLLDENSVFFYLTCPTSAPYHNEGHAYYPSAVITSPFNYMGIPTTQCPLGLNYKNMPIGMQIVGQKHNDALTIACAIELERIFGGWIPPEKACENNNILHKNKLV